MYEYLACIYIYTLTTRTTWVLVHCSSLSARFFMCFLSWQPIWAIVQIGNIGWVSHLDSGDIYSYIVDDPLHIMLNVKKSISVYIYICINKYIYTQLLPATVFGSHADCENFPILTHNKSTTSTIYNTKRSQCKRFGYLFWHTHSCFLNHRQEVGRYIWYSLELLFRSR